MHRSKARSLRASALVLFVACWMSNGVPAGDFALRKGGAVGEPLRQGIPAVLAALERRLPLEPRLPLVGTPCATLEADLTSAAFASPSTTDPDVDSMAAVAANPLSSNPDTARIQAALSSCRQGGFVRLAAAGPKDAFLTGPLTLPSGVRLWVDQGVTLYGSRYPADYTDAGLVAGDECGSASKTTTGKACKSLITVAAGARGSGVVGLGTIDGRGGSALTGGPQAGIMTWWDVALVNKVAGFSQNCPTLLDLTQGGSDFELIRIALLNSPHFHVKIDSYDGFVAWGVQVLTPSLAYSVPNYACAVLPSNTVIATRPGTCYTPDFTKNTDGIDPGGSRNVLIASSYFSDGDDNIAMTASNKSNCITTANGFCSSSNTLVAHNHFYYGHGMSVGSGTQGGVTGLFVWDLSIDGEDSSNGVGLRIKTSPGAGGEVSATYAKVCIQREKQPIVIDPFNSAPSSTTDLQPNLHDIRYLGIHAVNLPGAKYPSSTNWNNVMNGVSASNPLSNVVLDNVFFDVAPNWGNSGKAPFTGSPNFASFAIGPGSTSFLIPTTGQDVTVTGSAAGTATSGDAVDCANAFPPFHLVNDKSPI
ncbi:MAG TPA: glycosyl hydrolase family 28 protein [Steroidobacteraceae bacterium]